jgi:hypothetical protein
VAAHVEIFALILPEMMNGMFRLASMWPVISGVLIAPGSNYLLPHSDFTPPFNSLRTMRSNGNMILPVHDLCEYLSTDSLNVQCRTVFSLLHIEQPGVSHVS